MWLWLQFYVKWVQVYLNTVFKVQGGTADGDNLSLPVGEGILLSLGWSIWLQVYADSIGGWVSREYGGLSGVCRSRLSYSGIHKHLLKRSAGAAEPDTIRGGGKTHRSHWRVGMLGEMLVANKQAKKDGRSCHLKCVCSEEAQFWYNICGVLLFYVYCFNRGEMLKTRLATLNLCED